MGIEIQDVSKHYGSFHAVDRVNLSIKTDSLVALLGPSGSGKSTLLRMIAGLEQPDEGRIALLGRDATHIPVQKRNIGFVFQHYALFKHLTIRQNIGFALDLRKTSKARVRERVEELLALIQLQGLGDRYPSQLSGGQRQRVALARALAVQPQVLLLDEPFGALDAKVRKELRTWLRHLHEEVSVTTVFVTHDQEEAMEVADEIVVMNQGKVEQVGTATDIYDHPASAFVMSFIGPVNVVPVHSGILPIGNKVLESDRVFLRPHDIDIDLTASADTVPAQVDRIVHLGWEVIVEVRLESGELITVNLGRDRFNQIELRSDQRVHLKPKSVKTFPAYALK
ncbi:sulfate/molybdate ABC transporter ATP-binding protein [Leptolyngbya sp. NIES-2104]|uniref:sulfate/molybdate ABC transporter ATP-binding protein n=1 Tax=Leptolyngbya sp. NIES-2104 TaxID=1552121 RepID=UPI0006EC9C4C|nr:TOBE-like domain-containing protein [Leptolyngbya sp. NIES-2104]GAP94157.1 sulfate and thiosulfate import ATP-binding protein CysA [Leptolyngbya sp. NIES-2104]